MKQFPIRLARIAALSLVALAAACDRHPNEPDDHAQPASVELIDRDSGTRLAWTHGTGASIHWDGGLPHLHEGEAMAVNVRFLRANGSEIQLGGEYTVRARLAQQGEGAVGVPGIVDIENHGDHVDITGLAHGETHLVFMLWHGGHADFVTPAIAVEVDDH